MKKKHYSNNKKNNYYSSTARNSPKALRPYASANSLDIHSIALQIFGKSYYITYKDLLSVV